MCRKSIKDCSSGDYFSVKLFPEKGEKIERTRAKEKEKKYNKLRENKGCQKILKYHMKSIFWNDVKNIRIYVRKKLKGEWEK